MPDDFDALMRALRTIAANEDEPEACRLARAALETIATIEPIPDDVAEFAQAVWEMRELQREFFGTRPADRRPDLIVRARVAEAAVDRALSGRPAPAPQGRLFP